MRFVEKLLNVLRDPAVRGALALLQAVIVLAVQVSLLVWLWRRACR